jgi:hypothetical protein
MFEELDKILTKHPTRSSWAITDDGIIIKVDGESKFFRLNKMYDEKNSH